ncbi:MAG: phosphatase PAP2 family protein [Gemmatimonadota bacterium]|jgi:undecaprenyl-diphosphatase|nr:phosphatase PAP2 family protein [Gemmatimonadota bacterium]
MSPWIGRLLEQDERILLSVVSRRGRMGDGFMRAVSRFGDATTTVGVAIFLLLMDGTAGVGAQVAVALVVSHLMVQLLKRTLTRQRPTLPVGYESLIRAPDRFSFPSGHSAAAASVAIPLALFLPPSAGFVCLGLATLVGFSRCYLGVHYPGDVLAGWLLGVLGVVFAAGVL